MRMSPDTLNEVARRLGETAAPARVILFGSYARGDAGEHSDADFLVIKPQVDDARSEMIRLYRAIRPLHMPVDILLYSEEAVARKRDWCSSALYWAMREGKVLYESKPN